MKITTKIYAALVLTMLFCLTLTFADAAVDPKHDAELISKLTQSKLADKLQTGTVTDQNDNPLISDNTKKIPVFRFPAMLQLIESEAFEGTAIIGFELPESVESIGERAFANITTLMSVGIPEKTQSIGKDAFDGSCRVTISGAPDSYARAWARENGVPFAPITMICAVIQTPSGTIHFSDPEIETIKDDSGDGIEATAAWKTGDHETEFYKQQIAHQVQGRSPPVCA